MLPRYRRAEIPPAMLFQSRDGEILSALHRYDGVLSRDHLKSIFWPDASWRAMERRLSLLYHNGYLDWPSYTDWQTRPIPKPICWLGWKGILWIAGQAGLSFQVSPAPNESRLRQLEAGLREAGLHWLRAPRWSQLLHDLAIVDVRLAMERAVQGSPRFRLEGWVNESAFWRQTDVINFSTGTGKTMAVKKKGVRPDGYCVVVDQDRERDGQSAKARFLLEVDMATHDVNSFGTEKVAAGLAYLQSEAYRERFGANSGRWLVVTTSQRRLAHLVEQAARIVIDEPETFAFATLEQVRSCNPLTSAIWHRVDHSEATPLFAGSSRQLGLIAD